MALYGGRGVLGVSLSLAHAYNTTPLHRYTATPLHRMRCVSLCAGFEGALQRNNAIGDARSHGVVGGAEPVGVLGCRCAIGAGP